MDKLKFMTWKVSLSGSGLESISALASMLAEFKLP